MDCLHLLARHCSAVAGWGEDIPWHENLTGLRVPWNETSYFHTCAAQPAGVKGKAARPSSKAALRARTTTHPQAVLPAPQSMALAQGCASHCCCCRAGRQAGPGLLRLLLLLRVFCPAVQLLLLAQRRAVPAGQVQRLGPVQVAQVEVAPLGGGPQHVDWQFLPLHGPAQGRGEVF